MQQQLFEMPTHQDIIFLRKQTTFDTIPLLEEYRDKMEELYQQASASYFKHKNQQVSLPHIIWKQVNLIDLFVPTILKSSKIFFGDIREFVTHYPIIAKKYLAKYQKAPWKNRIFSVFTEACWNKAAILYVPCKVHATEIIDLPNIILNSHNFFIEKIIIILEKEAFIQINDSPQITSKKFTTIFRSIDCYLAPGSQLTMVNNQHDSNHHLLSRISFYLDSKSILNYAMITAGAKTNKLWLDIILKGANAQALIRGLYLLSGLQHINIESSQVHKKQNTKSDLLLKGVIKDKAHATYSGNIFVEKQAYQTNALQTNKNILLSDTAQAYSMPSLEILNHDVLCSHGSAVSQFDKEQLFYMQTRGLNKQTAQQLLLEGFASDLFLKFDKKIQKNISDSLKNSYYNFTKMENI